MSEWLDEATGTPPPVQTPVEKPRRRGFPWAWSLVAVLLAFSFGMIANPWFEREVRDQLPATIVGAGTDPEEQRLATIDSRLAGLETTRDLNAPAAQNIAVLAEKLATLDAQAGATREANASLSSRVDQIQSEISRSSGDAMEGDARMRDLYLIGVARRMVESGRPIDRLQKPLNERFHEREPEALVALTNWSRTPQTRRTLSDRLMAMKAESPTAATAENFWQQLRDRLSSMVRVRDESVPASKGPAVSLVAARAAMAENDLRLAVSSLSAADKGSEAEIWATDARILMQAEDALDRLDGLALDAAIQGMAQLPAPVATQAPVNVTQ